MLTVIDALSKYAWVEPVKANTGVAVAEAFEKILKRSDMRKPQKLQTDNGKEFYNKTFQTDSGPVQTPLHSCDEPNLIKFDFRATLERRLVQTAYLRRT